MWVFTKDGFFSVIQAESNKSTLIVRTRCDGDIRRFVKFAVEMGSNLTVRTDIGTDYKYRVSAPRWLWEDYMVLACSEIDYGNFKDKVEEKLSAVDPPATLINRVNAMYRCWAAMVTFQDNI